VLLEPAVPNPQTANPPSDTDDGVAHGVGGWWTVDGNGDPIMTS
jgi:hypothetical protein